MTTTNEDAGPSDVRAEFEAYARLRFSAVDMEPWIRHPEEYNSREVQAAWHAWRHLSAIYRRAPSKVQVEAVRATDDDDVESDGRLPALASTPEGKRLYSMAYARGRARERLNASGRLRASSRPAAAEEPTHQEMRLMLPEGGYVNLFWPDELTAESAHMLSEMFSTVMQAFARAAKSKSPDAAAASGGEKV